MAKHTQTIRRQEPMNCLRVFDHHVGLALKGLNKISLHELRMSQLNDLEVAPSRSKIK